MAQKSQAELKAIFVTGAKPTQQDFSDFIESSVPYKIYTAFLTQLGTDAPTDNVLENTLGAAVIWSRLDVGSYRGTLAGAFPTGKVAMFIGNNLGVAYQCGEENAPDTVFLTSGSYAGVLSDTSLDSTPIQIKIYP